MFYETSSLCGTVVSRRGFLRGERGENLFHPASGLAPGLLPGLLPCGTSCDCGSGCDKDCDCGRGCAVAVAVPVTVHLLAGSQDTDATRATVALCAPLGFPRTRGSLLVHIWHTQSQGLPGTDRHFAPRPVTPTLSPLSSIWDLSSLTQPGNTHHPLGFLGGWQPVLPHSCHTHGSIPSVSSSKEHFCHEGSHTHTTCLSSTHIRTLLSST